MHIKTIVIEGFKSYAQRTEINDFDPLFNAITGLNGSGKSNILDSICFLLGISNLSQVRATNLQDLVYKNGQAGITKATVSITFDNSDKKQSPLGFESNDEITVSRQVVIGGRNKYLINGVNATNTRVQDLFCSVGLNVNNPHFLIMQGRITKVLNMKPPEILAMIEEAAGTRMYECKKIAAQKTIEKKEAKLKEIKRILEEEITPTLQKLKEERSSYLEYQKVTRAIEHLSRLYVAYQFVLAEETKVRSADALKDMKANVEKLQKSIAESETKVKQLTEEIAEIEKKRDEEFGGTLRSLEHALSEIQRVDTRAQSALDLKMQNLKSEENKRKELLKSMEEDSKALVSKEKEVKKIQEGLNALQETSKKDADALATAQKYFNAVSAGLSSNDDGEEATLAEQMMMCKNEISKSVTESKQAEIKLKYAQKELKTKQAEVKKMDGGYKKDQEAFEAVRKLKEKLENEMKKLNYEDMKEETLSSKKKELTCDISRLRELHESLMAKFPSLHFEYRDPEKNWNRTLVKGLVACLIIVKDISTAKALEVVAGGKLYNIVVDTEVTGKKLLENGGLKRRYTVIPLNKISARCIAQETIKLAKNLVGNDSLHLALCLVEYEPELQKAMEYVFGTTLVCDNMTNAKRVTFDKRIMIKSVTLDGETFDPRGTLSGGSSSQSVPILSKLQEIKKVEKELAAKESELEAVEKELANLKNVAEKYQQLKQQWEMKSEEVELLQAKLQQSAYHKQEEELNALKKTIEQCEETLMKAKESQKKAEEKYKVLENKMKNAEAEREKELKDAQQKLDDTKKKADASSKKMKEKQQEVDALVLELEELKREQCSYKQQMEAANEAIKSFQEQVNAMAAEVSKNKESVEKAQKELAKQKEIIAVQDQEIKDKSAETVAYREQNNELQLKVKELEHNISKHEQEAAEAAAKVAKMLKEYEWIASEKPLFGQPNTAYDFKTNNPKEAGQKLQKLQEKKEKLGQNVNMRAMNMLSEAEERYNDLMKKKRIVENDKSKILATIEELDQKKNEALYIAWQKVNKDFGSIFSTLLPGAKAMLAAIKCQNILEGLEFRVALGNIWKENLTELSGGQRSLVALSLILAMLLFKPAPIYILDEVDAALDLSHTQNIGQMLHNHFRHSQFIVVSLKDGMFNNANVLYKTKFVDGVSTVARYDQTQSRNKTATSSKESKGLPKEKVPGRGILAN
ncbi:structural maintenance of chromosomes protein 2 isoform X1 [Nothoprocta perdicaria]|uniref:structural maintenance of chromosomes protein 2 isoform X1 n=1 Tax=Nothoprocta perdicaria TaxID=30464 RepID=UPI000E1C0489|nr:structural maintenance of chromosomes protein 2 isoform X1 [Nothoprocta perdicaria]XP_025896560.1 structural maintenance of chromosomes protein 2 isoform X1 [Nothoprocta perdicaria]XP_025896561.1 structural maintenance of chromosomes protein 2 isoform X1 [Nothoprocta perdicaria]